MISVAANITVLDAEGRTVVPGLIDLHGHMWDDASFRGALHFGVTTIREMGGPIARVAAFRDAIAAGVLSGPRVVFGGFQVYPGAREFGTSGAVIQSTTDNAAPRAIALARGLGADYIKLRIPANLGEAVRLIANARSAGMNVSGHCAHQLPLIAAGIRGKEHLSAACAARSDGLWYSDLTSIFRSGGLWVVPTTNAFAAVPRIIADTTVLQRHEAAEFVTPFLRWWALRLPPDRAPGYQRLARVSREATRKVVSAGLTVAPDDPTTPDALHYELEELVAAGMTPLEAIIAATGTAARIIGSTEIGTIAPGKWADLVILDADPLRDIRNTRRIRSVIKGGEILGRPNQALVP
ncbi:MAG: amidohydrolase family protein [Gemmatimonadota bacterium]